MLPITHCYSWSGISDKLRLAFFREWAEAGAEHLVFTCQLAASVMSSNAACRKLMREIRDSGLSFADAHAPFGPWDDLCVPDETLRPLMLDRQKLFLRACELVGVKTCTIHVGNCSSEYPEANHPETLITNVTRSLEELLPVAEKYQVILCIENIWDPINGSEPLLRQIRTFNSPWLGICFDAGHANLIQKDPGDLRGAANYQWRKLAQLPEVVWEPDILEKLLPHIVNCHLHDNFGVDDDHLLPGEGIIDWKTVMKQLARAPRLQVLQNEITSSKGNHTFGEQVRCFETLRGYMND